MGWDLWSWAWGLTGCKGSQGTDAAPVPNTGNDKGPKPCIVHYIIPVSVSFSMFFSIGFSITGVMYPDQPPSSYPSIAKHV